jgi:hypothetical protein
MESSDRFSVLKLFNKANSYFSCFFNVLVRTVRAYGTEKQDIKRQLHCYIVASLELAVYIKQSK